MKRFTTMAVLCSLAAALASAAGASAVGRRSGTPAAPSGRALVRQARLCLGGERQNRHAVHSHRRAGRLRDRETVGAEADTETARALLAGGGPKGYRCGPAGGGTNGWIVACVKGPKSAFTFAFTWGPLGLRLR